MTYRERRERKAERLREWAEGRDARAAAGHATADRILSIIPAGQPILVGHHSERRHRRDLARAEGGIRSGVENAAKAEEMRARADEIERQAASAIYDDDPNAIEQLEEKLSRLEAERDRRKAANAEYRKEHREELRGLTAYGRGQAVPYPSYSITNLTGTIGRTRDRLARLKREREHGPRDRIITARFAGECADCGAAIEKGDTIRYNRQAGARCATCQEGGA